MITDLRKRTQYVQYALSLSLTHLTSIQRNVNATQLNQSFHQIIHLFTNILI